MAALLGSVALTGAEKSARYDVKHRIERAEDGTAEEHEAIAAWMKGYSHGSR